MQYLKHIICCSLLFIGLQQAIAQRNVKDSIIGTPWVGVQYGANWTSQDLALRYGFLNHIGFMAGYKTNKNWFYGVDANYIFGNKIRVSGLFGDLVDSYGNITDMNGDPTLVVLYSRGFNANLAIGKVIPIFNSNLNSGLFIHAGAGMLAHKIRIETNDQVSPSIELEYKKGYDRLSMGINTHQFIGYAFMANRGFINFYGGFYIQEGFTKNQRPLFYDQPEIPVSTETMLDIQYGLKIGWFIPVYKRLPKEFYFD
jgi:hypothetical protein